MSDSDNIQGLTKSTPRETRSYMVDCIEAGITPFVHSSPGIGKSAITKTIAKEFDLVLLDERLSTRSPVDLSGLPDFQGEGKERRASFTPFDVFPTIDTPLPKGKNGWLLFLDEFNSASKATQAAAYKLILDRMVGLTPLNPNVAIVCAGNLATDRAIVNPMSTAMQSRLVHIEMVHKFEEWLEDVAYAQNYDSRIVSYLNYMPGKLMDFRPDHNDKTFCCPRTWEFMERLVKPKTNEQLLTRTKLYAGTITAGAATDFVNFTKVYAQMVSFAEIMRDPNGAEVPHDSMTKWAVVGHIIDKVDKDTFDKACTYIGRYSIDFQILFFRALMVRHPKLRSHPAFAPMMTKLSQYLNKSPYFKEAA